MHRVVLEGVTKVFDRRGGRPIAALSDVSLNIEDRECLVVVGPSGSGKTTLLRLIGGLEAPTRGQIQIGEKIVNSVSPQHRDVGMVFQTPALYPHMSVFENMAFGLKLRRTPSSETKRRVGEVAEILGLSDCLQARPAELSGGQRQRVAIGRTIVRRASLLLLDEPLANIDPLLRAQLRQDIAGIREKFGTTMIYVTHDHLEAMLVGDRVAVLHEGQLQQVAEPATLYSNPANVFIARFFGFPSINLFHGTIVERDGDLFFKTKSPIQSSGPIAAGKWPNSSEASGFSLKISASCRHRVPSVSQRPIVLGVRPEQITCRIALEDLPLGSVLQAEVSKIQRMGADTYVVAILDGCQFVARVPESFHAVPRQKFAFVFDTQPACFFDPTNGKAL